MEFKLKIMDKYLEEWINSLGYGNGDFYQSFEEEDKIVFKFPIPGIDPDKCSTKIKGNTLSVSIPEGDFTCGVDFTKKFDFVIPKTNVVVYTQLGMYVIKITKPENYEYEVRCNI